MLDKDEQIEKKSKGKGEGKRKVGEGGDFSRSLFLSCSVPREANGGAHAVIKREKKNPESERESKDSVFWGGGGLRKTRTCNFSWCGRQRKEEEKR